MTLMIRPALPADLENAIHLLQQAGLPTDDLVAGNLALIAEKKEVFRGVIGVERYGRAALLRSLLVSGEARGAGIGPALVTALETMCVAENICEMWLLTIDADAFFAKLGYETRRRSDAPDAIRNSAEFSGLCPDDAYLMSKNLNPDD